MFRRSLSRRSLWSVVALAGAAAAGLTAVRSQPARAAAAAAAAVPTPVYAQLSSPDTQEPKDASPMLVAMTSNDAIGGIEHSDKAKTTEVTVKTAGVYFLVAAIQVGKDKPGEPGDHLDVWMKQNGKDVDNSNCRQVIHDAKFTTVLVCQGIAECKAGDVFNVAIAASAAGHGIGIKAIKPQGRAGDPEHHLLDVQDQLSRAGRWGDAARRPLTGVRRIWNSPRVSGGPVDRRSRRRQRTADRGTTNPRSYRTAFGEACSPVARVPNPCHPPRSLVADH